MNKKYLFKYHFIGENIYIMCLKYDKTVNKTIIIFLKRIDKKSDV